MGFANLKLPVVSKSLVTPLPRTGFSSSHTHIFFCPLILSSECVENLWTALHSLPCCDTFKLFNSTVGGRSVTQRQTIYIFCQQFENKTSARFSPAAFCGRELLLCFYHGVSVYLFFHYEDLPMKKNRCSSMCSQQTLPKPWLL